MVTPGASAFASPPGSFAGSITRSRASTTTSSQQLRANPVSAQNATNRMPPEGYFAPASRRSSQASQGQSSSASPQKQRQQTPSPQKQQSSRRSSLGSEIDASRTAPGAAFQRPQTQMEVAFRTSSRQLSGSQSARSLGRSESVRSLARSESARSLNSARMGGSQSARNLPSERMVSAREYGRPRSARSSAASSYSDFSGCSTPIAGATWGHLTRSFGNGVGKQVFPNKKDNLIVGDFLNENRLLERTDQDDVRSSIERCIGHGKKMDWNCKAHATHLHGAVPVAAIPTSPKLSETFGEAFKEMAQANDGLDANIGHGIKKFPRSTHGRHHISDDCESEPGLHGHHRGQDYKDGMLFVMGHGKRRVAPGHKQDTVRIPPSTPGSPKKGSPTVRREVAGLSTRDIVMGELAGDPSRRGTYQDRRKPKESVRTCPFASRML